jgi:hypothetical protein
VEEGEEVTVLSWWRKRRAIADIRLESEIFGLPTDGLPDEDLERRSVELNRRIAEEWRGIESYAQEHVYSPLPPNASTEEIRDFVQGEGEIVEMEAFRDCLRARRLANETECDRDKK